MLYMGIDTSCYTSSVAIVNSNEKVIFDKRIILKVDDGSRGLRQSEAVFQHSNNLSSLIQEAFDAIRELDDNIASISVSDKPRDIIGSYMPVFTAGLNAAKVIGACLNCPVITLSHQQNHIIAGSWSSGEIFAEDFLVYHISGGTTELLHVKSIKVY
jgi:N6-L-threonylcarbamoyladenine synthase